MAALASARSPQAEVPPRQNSLQMAEEEDTSTLKLKHLSEAIAMLTDPKVTTVLDILIMYRHIYWFLFNNVYERTISAIFLNPSWLSLIVTKYAEHFSITNKVLMQ